MPNSSWSPSTPTHDTTGNQGKALLVDMSNSKNEEDSMLPMGSCKSNTENKAVTNVVDLSRDTDEVHVSQFAPVHETESRPADTKATHAAVSFVPEFSSGQDIKPGENDQRLGDESLSQEKTKEQRITAKASEDEAYQEQMGIHSTVHAFPSTRMPKCEHSQTYAAPCMINLLPSCPRSALIPGLPSLFLTQQTMEWPFHDTSESIIPPKVKTVKLIYNLGIQYHDVDTVRNMVSLRPTCPRSVCTPGFPSVPFYKEDTPNMGSLLPTCPKASSVSGLPSRLPVTTLDEGIWPKNDVLLWERKPKQNEEKHIPPALTENKDMSKLMILMRPSCAEASKIPGFPSASRSRPQEHPSMVNMLPSCPRISNIAGFPSSNLLSKHQYVQHWPSDVVPLFVIQMKDCAAKLIIDLEKSYCDIRLVRNMVSLRQTCPRAAIVSGFPSAPNMAEQLSVCPKTSEETNKSIDSGSPTLHLQKDLSIVNMFPSCSNISRIIGFPSVMVLRVDQDMIQQWISNKNVLIKMPKKKETNVNVSSPQIMDTVKENIGFVKAMVALVPTCPRKAQAPGFPSASTQNEEDSHRMKGDPTSCPKVSGILGMPSVSNTDTVFLDEWPMETEPFWVKGIRKDLPCSKLSCPLQYECVDDKDSIKSMSLLMPSCPRKATLPGFPSAPRPISDKPMMLSCPSETSGSSRLESDSMTSFPLTTTTVSQTKGNIIPEQCDIDHEHQNPTSEFSPDCSVVNGMTQDSARKLDTCLMEETKEDLGFWARSEEGDYGILEKG